MNSIVSYPLQTDTKAIDNKMLEDAQAASLKFQQRIQEIVPKRGLTEISWSSSDDENELPKSKLSSGEVFVSDNAVIHLIQKSYQLDDIDLENVHNYVSWGSWL